MFIHISPEHDALGETISTLKFGERVSTVELGSARPNKDGADVRELKEQVSYLLYLRALVYFLVHIDLLINIQRQIANLKAALLRKEKGEFGFQPSFSPDRGNGSFTSSPSPSWQSMGDVSKSEV